MAMQHIMVALWKTENGVFIKELDSNLYLFQFYHEIDVKRVLEGCPWSFNRRALDMARLKEGVNTRCVDLNFMELWVQVHDLKAGFMPEKILRGIDNYIDSDIPKPYGSWMRAPYRNQVKPIGVNWLRNGGDAGGFNSEMMKQGSHGKKDDSNQDPKISPINMQVVRKGENSGAINLQNLKSGREINIETLS
ncbi:hypothetical protein AgCh_000143 [Apium graveolens]